MRAPVRSIRWAIAERIGWASRHGRAPRGVVLDPTFRRHVDLSWTGLPVIYEEIAGATPWIVALSKQVRA